MYGTDRGRDRKKRVGRNRRTSGQERRELYVVEYYRTILVVDMGIFSPSEAFSFCIDWAEARVIKSIKKSS